MANSYSTSKGECQNRKPSTSDHSCVGRFSRAVPKAPCGGDFKFSPSVLGNTRASSSGSQRDWARIDRTACGCSSSVNPYPYTWNIWPFTPAAASLDRYTTSGATLSGSRSVPFAISLGHLPVSSNIALPRGVESIMRVAPLGMMAFTVTPYLASALAVDQVRPMMPALAAAEFGWPGAPSADTDD